MSALRFSDFKCYFDSLNMIRAVALQVRDALNTYSDVEQELLHQLQALINSLQDLDLLPERLREQLRKQIIRRRERLLRFLEQLREQIIQRRERLLRFLEHLALLLLTIIRFLLSRIRSAGFMNRHRPKCTTMPWEIWPSLVVLWGVCWMFYPPAFDQNGNQYQPSLEDEQLPFFSDDFQNPAWVPLPFSNEFLEFWDGFDGTGSLSYFNPDLFDGTPQLQSPQIEFPAFPVQEGLNELADHGPLSGQVIPSMLAPSTNPPEMNWEQSTSKSIASPPSSPHTRRVPDRNPSISFAGPSTSSPQRTSPENASGAYQPPQEPPRNTAGHYLCEYPGCTSTQTFPRRSEWLTHTHKHTRPFRCTITDCKGNTGFATKGVLDRHVRLKHRNSQSDGFSPPEIANALTAVEINEMRSESLDPNLALRNKNKGKGKSKRMFTNEIEVPHVNEEYEESTESRGDLKKAKLAACECNSQVNQLEADLVREREEKKEVQRELKISLEELARFQREQEVLLGIVERLRKD